MRLIGLDPGLRRTGWGIIDVDGNRLRHVADGVVTAPPEEPVAVRLAILFEALTGILDLHRPLEAAVEETFVNRNPASALKLGYARGIALLVPAGAGIPVAEYPANVIKKSLVGAGHAQKEQVAAMVRMLLPGARAATSDAADALAVAVCHAHHLSTRRRWAPETGPARAEA